MDAVQAVTVRVNEGLVLVLAVFDAPRCSVEAAGEDLKVLVNDYGTN